MRVLAPHAVVLFAGHGNGEEVAFRAVDVGLHLRIRQGAVVPRARPVVGRHVDLATGVQARNDPVVRPVPFSSNVVITIVDPGCAGWKYPINDSNAVTIPA